MILKMAQNDKKGYVMLGGPATARILKDEVVEQA
jgi:hypothetical protein